MAETRHFLDIADFDKAALRQMLELGIALRRGEELRGSKLPLAGKTLAMIMEKPSTRTRVSFQVAMEQLGGRVVVLDERDSQLRRGETIGDTARVLSRYVDALVMRTDDHARLVELAAAATVPVINGLTDRSHPCQLMADVMTFEAHRGPIEGRTVAWSGDGNNVAASWVHAAVRFEFSLQLACPPALSPPQELLDWARAEGGDVTLRTDAAEAVTGADLVVTDTWVSMGDGEAEERHALLEPYRVDTDLMGHAADDALFMHCLPAHRGDEVTAEVMDGPQSVVWDEAENRLHAQKGLLAWCIS